MFEIKFETDNAAFEDMDYGFEVAKLLREIADKQERWRSPDGIEHPVIDTNGNKVGTWRATQ